MTTVRIDITGTVPGNMMTTLSDGLRASAQAIASHLAAVAVQASARQVAVTINGQLPDIVLADLLNHIWLLAQAIVSQHNGTTFSAATDAPSRVTKFANDSWTRYGQVRHWQ